MNMVNTEFKTVDRSLNVSMINTGTTSLLNGLQQGDDYDNRDGRQVRFKSVQIAGKITRSSGATHAADRVRLAIVIDKQPNAAACNYGQIFQATTPDAFRNLDYRKRFVILWSRTMVIDADDPEKHFKFYKKIDMKTVYDASNVGDVTDIQTNALYFVTIAETSVNIPSADLDTRVRFIDN